MEQRRPSLCGRLRSRRTLLQIAAEDPSGYAAASGPSTINTGDGHSQIGVYSFDVNVPRESFYWSHDRNLSDDVKATFGTINNGFGEDILASLVKAGLDEKYGLADHDGLEFLGGDDGSVTLALKTSWGPTDAVVLTGGETASLIAGYGDALDGLINVGDGSVQTAIFDTNTETQGFWGNGTKPPSYNDAGDAFEELGFGFALNNHPTRPAQQEVDDFVLAVLNNQGDDDIDLVAGGQQGDDFVTVSFTPANDVVDTLIVEGAAVEAAIDTFYFA